MSRFTQELLPEAIVQTKEKLQRLELAQRTIAIDIDFFDEWADHDCNCEYCESKQNDLVDPEKREELEALQVKNEEEITTLKADILSMESYQTFAERNNV